jgi:hypothetical protein
MLLITNTKSKNHFFLKVLFILFIFVCISETAMSANKITDIQNNRGSSFRHIQLAYGISLDIPSHWTVFSQDARNNFSMAGEAIAENAGIEQSGRKENLLAVNATPDPTGAMIRVSTTSPPDYTQSDLTTLTPADLKIFGIEMYKMVKKIELSGCPKIIEMQPVRMDKFNNYNALVLPYVRASKVGGSNWQVTQYKIPVYNRLIELTISHRQSDAVIWQPILEKVKRSVKF